MHAQVTDSLWRIYQDPSRDSTVRIEALHRLARFFIANNPDSAYQLAQTEQSFAESMRDSNWIAFSLNLQGGALTASNDFPAALDRFYRMLDIRVAMKDTSGIAAAYNNIGNIYFYKGDYSGAIDFYTRSLHYEELKPKQSGLASSYLNIGSVYALQQEYDDALDYFKKALKLFRQIEDQNGIASALANMGNAYRSLDSLDLAMSSYHEAEQLMTELKDDYGLSMTFLNLAELHRLKGDTDRMFDYFRRCEVIRQQLKDEFGLGILWTARGTAYDILGRQREALAECEKGLKVAEKFEALKEQQDACDCLYQAHKGLKQDKLALAYYERRDQLQDSMARDETLSKLRIMEFRKQVTQDSLAREAEKEVLAQKHKQQLRQSKRVRNVGLIGGAGLLVLSIMLYRLFYKTRASKAQSDHVLENILPADIAEQLKATGKVDAREFDDVTILFTDFVNFTLTSAQMRPQELVDELNAIYSGFDAIVSGYGIEKIKSIGDAYMAAGGLPQHDDTSVRNTVLAALDMQAFINTRNAQRKLDGQEAFEMRAGIHTGPVVAGIIGVKKFQYDVWGDTVNTANRMETNGAPGEVNISATTYQILKDDPGFVFEARNAIQVKGKGEMQMYFVRRKEA